MRIGILQTDAVREELQGEFGDYPSMFHDVLARGADGVAEVGFANYDVRRGEYPATLDECDAYLITGSRDSVYDEAEWIDALTDFVIRLDEARKSLVGICFGHQLIAHALDGETAPAEQGWAVGVHESDVVARKPWMAPSKTTFRLISSHKDQVVKLPSRAELFAGNVFCPYAGFTIGDHMLTFQGHPEFEPGYAARLIEWRRQILGEERYTRGLASLEQPLDDDLVARWIVNFLTGVRS